MLSAEDYSFLLTRPTTSSNSQRIHKTQRPIKSRKLSSGKKRTIHKKMELKREKGKEP